MPNNQSLLGMVYYWVCHIILFFVWIWNLGYNICDFRPCVTAPNHQAFNEAQTESCGWHMTPTDPNHNKCPRQLFTSSLLTYNVYIYISICMYIILIISSSNSNTPHVHPKWKDPMRWSNWGWNEFHHEIIHQTPGWGRVPAGNQTLLTGKFSN